MNINPNVAATLNNTNSAAQSSLERLSSGYKINSARDDNAGLDIASRLNAGNYPDLDVHVRNANDAVSMAQTAEGALNEITNILQRMRDLSQQAANGSNSEAERVAIQEEVTALHDELNRIAETTSFGGRQLLDGTLATQSFQIGSDKDETVQLILKDMHTSMMGVDGLDVTTVAGAQRSVASIDAALNYVEGHRAELSAFLNRCQHTINNLANIRESVNQSASRIRDSDFAKESSKLTKSQILSQASEAILAQANQQPNEVLKLLD